MANSPEIYESIEPLEKKSKLTYVTDSDDDDEEKELTDVTDSYDDDDEKESKLTDEIDQNADADDDEKESKLTYVIDTDDEDGSDVERYNAEIDASDGFDIQTVPKGDLLIVPLLGLLNATDLLNKIKLLSGLAIEHYNNKHNGNYKLVKVLKANAEGVAGIIYYITFEAAEGDVNGGEVKVFQGKVWKGVGFNKVLLCRLKPTTN